MPPIPDAARTRLGLPPRRPPRREQLAINLCDLDRVDPFLRQTLLGGKLDLSEPVRTDPNRIDETAVRFSCDLLTAGCVCDVLRGHDKRAGDYPTRVYVRRKAWSKVPGTVPLTVVDADGRVALNPAVFAEEAPEVVIIPPSPERVF